MVVLLTGMAGFIGFHTALRLAADGHNVVGVDNLNPYYDVGLKYGRLAQLGFDRAAVDGGALVESARFPGLSFRRLDLSDRDALADLAGRAGVRRICHLAAQAGVRYSLENPHAYAESNLAGFLNVLELARALKVEHLAYASSSSVYGLNAKQPFSTADAADRPVSLYAATKKANELMAHAYAHLYRLPCTGLRFFTVYGPWGRPDMALFLFTKAILEGKPIQVFNEGRMRRDFTYVDDIVEAVVRVLDRIPPEDPLTKVPQTVYNVGNGAPVGLTEFIDALEASLGRAAVREYKAMQPGDVVSTWADTADLERELGVRPRTDIRTGVDRFVAWYREYYRI